MPEPFFSIVMPSLNQGEYIEEAITSILSQDYARYELIVIDGGSTDGSRGIIEKYAGEISYWQSKPDRGQTDAIIEGLKHARGDLLGWVNADDVLLPGCLRQIALAQSRHPGAGLFGGNYVILNSAGSVSRCKQHPHNPEKFARMGLLIINQPGSFFRPDDYYACGGLHVELHYVMDTDLYIRMLLNGTEFAYVDEYLAGFRVHPRAKTVAHSAKAIEEGRFARLAYLPADVNRSPRRRIGLMIYYWQQVKNGKYLRAYRDYLSKRGRHWWDWK